MLFREVQALLFCAALALGAPPSKGKAGLVSAEGRIVGGTPVAKGEFPWHVSLQSPPISGDLEWEHSCDGAIVSNEFIVTDWFCDANVDNRVVAGTLNWTAPGSIHSVLEVIEEDVSDFGYLSLWKVDPPFTFSSDVAPVRLPAQNAESAVGSNVTATGWNESPSGTYSDTLVKLDLSIVPIADCRSPFTTYTICAGGGQGSFCTHQGQGAPLVLDGELRGLLALASAFCDRPAIFTEVSPFRDWIARVAGV